MLLLFVHIYQSHILRIKLALGHKMYVEWALKFDFSTPDTLDYDDKKLKYTKS